MRAFYAINNEQGKDPIFIPFPGYSNLNVRGDVIDAKNSNGESDSLVPKSNIYAFESENLITENMSSVLMSYLLLELTESNF